MDVLYCEPCRLSFGQAKLYHDHLDESPQHHYCRPCQRKFESQIAMQQHIEQSQKHYDSEKHRICKWCGVESDDLGAHNGHNHSKCRQCRRWYKDEKALDQHRTAGHSDIYCNDCKRVFKDPNGLKMHLASPKHAPKKHKCPHPDCGVGFITLACLIAHLETGNCPSGMDLDKIENCFLGFDEKQLFIKSERIRSAYNSDVRLCDSKENQCPICYITFLNPEQLDQHLSSSKHKNRGNEAFTCPSHQCESPHFVSLSSLLHHRESQKCQRGYNRVLRRLCSKLVELVQVENEAGTVGEKLEELTHERSH